MAHEDPALADELRYDAKSMEAVAQLNTIQSNYTLVHRIAELARYYIGGIEPVDEEVATYKAAILARLEGLKDRMVRGDL